MDPRTKLLVLLAVNICVMTVVQVPVTLTGLGIALLLLALARLWRVLGGVTLLFAVFAALSILSQQVENWAGAIGVIIGEYGTRVTVILALAVWLFSTTTPAAFVAALKRAHVPDAITIPLSVMFRFFPAVLAEFRAIRDAMQVRGLFATPGSMATHPIKTSEYLMVPLIGSTMQLTDDLSASAMVRGLGRPGKSTSIAHVGFGAWDMLGVALAAAQVIVFVAVVFW